MRIASGGLLIGVFLAFVGCGGTGTPGGPGAKTEAGKTDRGVLGSPAEETFTINVPLTSTKLKQGESKPITLSLKRGTNFDEDVTLKFDGLPNGVTVEPSSPKIPKSEKDVKATIKAAENAALGDFNVQVTGEPTRGKAATNTVKVTVEKA
jgi:uncharacterized membrane protein